MTARKSITKKTRFEVFKRDGFKCVYCGACAPEAVLVVDHIDPVAKGGANEIVNYATACQPCNAGKSDRKLDDNSTLQKQRRQLDELNTRREQLEMMLAWRNTLKQGLDDELECARAAWAENVPGWTISAEPAMKLLRKFVKKHGLAAVLDAIEIAAENYAKRDAEGRVASEFAQLAWKKIGGILALHSMPDDQRRLYYVQGILRNRLSYVAPNAIRIMQAALEAGIDVEEIVSEAKVARNWTGFMDWICSAGAA
jgi:hypothetical protein